MLSSWPKCNVFPVTRKASTQLWLRSEAWSLRYLERQQTLEVIRFEQSHENKQGEVRIGSPKGPWAVLWRVMWTANVNVNVQGPQSCAAKPLSRGDVVGGTCWWDDVQDIAVAPPPRLLCSPRKPPPPRRPLPHAIVAVAEPARCRRVFLADGPHRLARSIRRSEHWNPLPTRAPHQRSRVACHSHLHHFQSRRAIAVRRCALPATVMGCRNTVRSGANMRARG